MLSLPLIIPRDDQTFYTNPLRRPFDLDPPTSTPNQPPRRPTSSSSRHNHPAHPPHPNPLTLLAADEALFTQRKLNVRRFGASWIRPPGVGKTYQATMDEAAEREEQEAQMRREMEMEERRVEMEAQEEAARLQLLREQGGGEGEEEGEERDLDEEVVDAGGLGEGSEDEEMGEDEDEVEERDLDEEIPDADGEEEDDDDEEEGSEVDGGNMTFNEESVLEGSVLPEEVSQFLHNEEVSFSGVLQESQDLERDLDEDVPEPGSYQHTDTEIEDSSDLELESSFTAPQSARRPGTAGSGSNMPPPTRGGRGQGTRLMTPRRARYSMLSEGQSSLLESSFIGSSPVPPTRGSGFGNAFRNRLLGLRPGSRSTPSGPGR